MNDDYPKTYFGLLRHACTVWNLEKRIQGHQDSPLTPEGTKQAKYWGKCLKMCQWDRIVASDLGRVQKTADLINSTLQLPVTQDPRLREKDWGEWSGKTIYQIKKQEPKALAEMEKAGWRFCPPGGEDRCEVWKRSCQALIDASKKWPGQKILVITHMGVIKCLFYRLLDRQFLPDEPKVLQPIHLHELSFYENKLQLEKINSICLK